MLLDAVSQMGLLCFPTASRVTQISDNNIMGAGGNVYEIVSTLQMNLQAFPLKTFFFFAICALLLTV